MGSFSIYHLSFVICHFLSARLAELAMTNEKLFEILSDSFQMSNYVKCQMENDHPFARGSRCPPNFWRIAERIFSANVCSCRERKRIYNAAVNTSAGTASSIAA